MRSVVKRVAEKPLLNVEHCEGCLTVLPRGHVRVVQVDPNPRFPSAFKFLCPKCAKATA